MGLVVYPELVKVLHDMDIHPDRDSNQDRRATSDEKRETIFETPIIPAENGIVSSMADSLSPDQIAQRTFRRGLRGYDPQEVEAFLEEVAGSVRHLESRHEALHTRLLELGNRDLTAEFDLVSQDVGRILQDAREAASSPPLRQHRGVAFDRLFRRDRGDER